MMLRTMICRFTTGAWDGSWLATLLGSIDYVLQHIIYLGYLATYLASDLIGRRRSDELVLQNVFSQIYALVRICFLPLHINLLRDSPLVFVQKGECQEQAATLKIHTYLFMYVCTLGSHFYSTTPFPTFTLFSCSTTMSQRRSLNALVSHSSADLHLLVHNEKGTKKQLCRGSRTLDTFDFGRRLV